MSVGLTGLPKQSSGTDLGPHEPSSLYGRGSAALGFWSRFAVTFDFRGRNVYLRKSARFNQRGRWNATGLHRRKRRGLIEVAAVDPGSPALQAGLESGDVLVQLDGQSAAKLGLFEVRSALRGGGRLTCVVRRDSEEMRLSISRPRQGQ